MTKLVCCDEVVLGKCDMMYEPSGVGISEGETVEFSAVMEFVEVR